MHHEFCKRNMFCDARSDDYCSYFEPTEEYLRDKTCGQCDKFAQCCAKGQRRIDWACPEFFPLFSDFSG